MKYYVGRVVGENPDKTPVYEFYNFQFVSASFGTTYTWHKDKADAHAFDEKSKAQNVIGGDERLKTCKVLEE